MSMIGSVKTLCVALVMTAMEGCATVGKDFATHNVDQIQIGETTRADIQEMFGEPWRTGIEDGKRTWTYGKYKWSAKPPIWWCGSTRTEPSLPTCTTPPNNSRSKQARGRLQPRKPSFSPADH